ncbi:TnsA endonuclease N-terminal domain-containing protein [Silvimonas iriomotensis]|nr:TnsA endonuclease N-terminal domain-containing protein [Silvimonas iriomotensis]
MAKRKYGIDEAKIARFLKEGRGEGHGVDYLPWLTIQDVSSSGHSTRMSSRVVGRVHHLLSDIETHAFVTFDWSDSVRDIREQFPLDRDETREIAMEMGVKHPNDPSSRCDIVMTSDFVLDVFTPAGMQMHIRAVKPSEELSNPRVVEKLEIERRYWYRRNVASWGVITEREVPVDRAKNLLFFHGMLRLDGVETPYPGFWEDRCNRFLHTLKQSKQGGTLRGFLRYLESAEGFAAGEGLTVLRHLAANKRLDVNLDLPYSPLLPLDWISIPGNARRDAMGQGGSYAAA